MLRKEPWVWAVGIEDTFIAQTARGEMPLDEFSLTQHYQFWRDDLERARSLGVDMIRYGIPWYRVEPEPDTYDWSWTDMVMDYFAQHRDLIPIVDLVHYGTPLWLKHEFANGLYPERVAAYAAAFAMRYRSVARYYTPFNEPYICAEWCGWSGTWPPYLSGHVGFVRVLHQICQGIVRTITAIRCAQPDAVIVQVEASKKYVPKDDAAREMAVVWNEIRYVAFDLILGRVTPTHPLYRWLVDCGLSPAELAWYVTNAADIDVIGLNYYPQFSVNVVDSRQMEDERIPGVHAGSAADLTEIVADAHRRYRKPVFITETSYWGSVDERVCWMDELFEACLAMRKQGIDLCGVTWFPFIDMIDWQYRTNGRSLEENLATFGLFALKLEPDGTLSRVRTAAADRFQSLVARTV